MTCPSEDVLADFVAGRLVGGSRDAVERHAAECVACSDVLTMVASLFVSDDPEPDTEAGSVSDTPHELRPGETVGRFVVLHEVGRGGMGAVYAAYDHALDRRVALKVLTVVGPGPHAQALLRDEARAMAQLVHPNVVTVLDVGLDDCGGEERLFIAMEFVEGGTLRAWLREDRSPQAILAVLVDAARGLAAAHRAGFVHNDFKPDNVLVDETSHARVTDFGLARALDAGPQRDARGGTVQYMAPEQVEGRDAGPVTDVFGWAVTAWEALYGARPFPDRGSERASAIADGPGEGAPQREVDPVVHGALLKGLHSDPNERWQSMDALIEVLTRRSGHRRPIGWAVGIGSGVALLAAVGLFSRETPPVTPACLDADAVRGEVWPAARRDAFERRFADGGSSAIQSVDDYVDDWVGAIGRHCEAATDQTKTNAEVALGAECLRLRGRELDDVLAHLMQGERVEVPGRLVSALSRPGDCNEPSRYLVAEYRYASPDEREASLEVDRLLSRATVASLRGEVMEAQGLAEDAAEVAAAAQRHGAWARALLAVADYQGELGDDRVASSLAEALRHATLAGDHDLAFQTVLERLDMLEQDDATSTDTLVWLAELARTHAAAGPDGPTARQEREVLWRLGYGAWRHGDVRRAEATWNDMRALELPDRTRADDYVDNLTVSLLAVSQGRWSIAGRAWRAAAEVAQLTAPQGVGRLQALHNAAYSTCAEGRVADARTLYGDAHSVARSRYQGPAPAWLDLWVGQARCELSLGHAAPASDALGQARVMAASLSVSARQRRRMKLLALRLETTRQQPDIEFEALRDGAEVFDRTDELELIEADWGLSLLERGRPAEAAPHFARVHMLSAERVGPLAPVTLAAQAWLGVALSRTPDREQALEHLDRALSGLLPSHEGHPAAILNALAARASIDPDRARGDRAQAQALMGSWGLQGWTPL